MVDTKYTFCPICTNHCAFRVTISEGKVVDVTGAGETGFPVNICSLHKGAAHIIGILNAPDRLKHPLKRAGKRGEGKWERISWDEALDTIAAKLVEIRDNYDPKYTAVVLNEPKGMEFAFWQRFATAYGTPNVITPGCYCGVQTGMAFRYMFGTDSIRPRMENPRVIVVWGADVAHTGGTFVGVTRNDLNKALVEGCKLVVIDPRNVEIWPEKSMFASNADYWLRPRPNSDGLLAMGMLKVIIEEGLYDPEYIAEWTIGFDALKEEVKKFGLDDLESLTWVPKQQIIEVARLYARNKPGIIGWGNALEGNSQAFQACRAIAMLHGITGNVNTPDGGELAVDSAPICPPGRFMFSGPLKERIKEFPRSPERSLAGEFRLALAGMYVPTQSLVKALLDGKPYRPKVALLCLTNPLLTYPDSKRTYEAFMKLDLLVVSEVFHTLTTEIADIILPAAYSLCEYDTVGYWPAWYGHARAHPKLADPPGEAWPDLKIVNELAKKVGLRKYFWEDWRESLDYMIEPAGITWERFRDEVRYLEAKSKYSPVKVSGYGTPSGKVELYSKQLEEIGCSPIPRFEELKEPLGGAFELSDKYPLMETNYKSEVFMLSGFRNVKELAEKSPPPTVFMNTETVKKLDLKEGDWVWIETRRGRVKQRLMTDPGIHPKVVNTEFGWGGTKEFKDSNINVLTDCDPPYDKLSGSVAIRGYPCKVYKASPTPEQPEVEGRGKST
ncbi:MAG: molybdopterin-dependent oxidoreductase [Chloroflexota bacterium]